MDAAERPKGGPEFTRGATHASRGWPRRPPWACEQQGQRSAMKRAAPNKAAGTSVAKALRSSLRELMIVLRFLVRTLMSRGFCDRNLLRWPCRSAATLHHPWFAAVQPVHPCSRRHAAHPCPRPARRVRDARSRRDSTRNATLSLLRCGPAGLSIVRRSVCPPHPSGLPSVATSLWQLALE